jgi:hypothetical protein
MQQLTTRASNQRGYIETCAPVDPAATAHYTSFSQVGYCEKCALVENTATANNSCFQPRWLF